jgi:CBS domain-containing protein
MSVYFIYNNKVNSFDPSYIEGKGAVKEATAIGLNTTIRAHSIKEKFGNLTLAREIMKTKVRVLNLDNNLSDAHKLFETYGFHHLPIIENTKLIGLISSNDLRNLADLGNKSNP